MPESLTSTAAPVASRVTIFMVGCLSGGSW
jgi:hypothetical protein